MLTRSIKSLAASLMLSAALVAGAGVVAHAAPTISVEAAGVTTSSQAGTSVFDFDTVQPTLSVAQQADLYTASVGGVAAEPYHFSNGNKYFSVGGGSSQSSTTITASQLGGSSFSYFGLYWGSMDSYNTLSFYNGASLLYSLTGSTAAALVGAAASGAQGSDLNNRFVNFDFGAQSFTSVVFASSSPAFETDNWTVRSSEQASSGNGVPEPGTLAIAGVLGLGFLGVGAMRRHRLNVTRR